jgi:hypothetical protein
VTEGPRDRARAAAEILRPHVPAVLACIPETVFSTRQYMMAFREVPAAAAAYDEALALWGEERRLGLLAIHGQVGPRILRESGLAIWLGYVGNSTLEDDGLHVPARWRKTA